MLTIGKLGAARGRLEYYDAQVAKGAEDYYSGRGEAPGTWRGGGAPALGSTVGARVERGGFMALMRGRHPESGEVLRVMGKHSTVAGLDLTFSAPKSVSVLFAISDQQTSSALLAAHERAVDAALAYLEREACFTRRGRDGAERLHGEGFIAASYRHRMSRAGDPQLHTHVVVGNLDAGGWALHGAGRPGALRAQVGWRRGLPGRAPSGGTRAAAVGVMAPVGSWAV